MTKNNNSNRNNESGNAFIIVMVGVVMFVALSFTVSKGMRSDNTNKLSVREIELAASDILNYASQMERAINRMRRNGISETELDFSNTVDTAYITNPNCIDDTCKVFHPAGGNIRFTSPPDGANDGTLWRINGRNNVHELGRTCFGSSRCTDLIMFLNGMDLDVCNEINAKLGHNFSTPPTDPGNAVGYKNRFGIGSMFGSNTSIGDATGNPINGLSSACVQTDATPTEYHFFYALIIR
jgi:hypothetical protein